LKFKSESGELEYVTKNKQYPVRTRAPKHWNVYLLNDQQNQIKPKVETKNMND
jgi:hypothetical protein